jgi:hypothetical protein
MWKKGEWNIIIIDDNNSNGRGSKKVIRDYIE